MALSFVPNAGQTDARVRYQARGAGHGIFFTDSGARLAFSDGKRGTALELGFLGIRSTIAPQGERPSSGRANYLIGNDPRSWRTGLPTYGQLVYRNLWPGIDLTFRGAKAQLKYELLVRPGARIENARLAWRGADSVSVDRRGNLLVRTRLGAMRDQRPVSYQEIDGRRVPVGSRFVLAGDGSFGFALGGHDGDRPVVVDPGLVYSTLLGGTGNEQGRGIAVDASGRAIVTGLTTSTDFPTIGAFDPSLGGGQDAFVTRLNAAGSALEFSTYLGGTTSSDAGFAAATDTAGNVFVTGTTASTDFPGAGSGFDPSYGGSGDGFVAKLDTTGALLAATYLGGTGSDQGFGIAVDASGSPTLTGVTASSGYPTTPTAFDTVWNGLNDGFATKLTPTLSALAYSTFLGGTGVDSGQAVAIDATGKAILTGVTASAGFPTTPGAYDTVANGLEDVFVTKLDLTGSNLDFSTFLGAGGSDQGFGIALDASGSPVVTGYTGSSTFPTSPGAFDSSYNGGSFDAFAAKLDPAGATLTFSTFLGGASTDQAFGIALDGSGRPTLTGTTNSAGWPTTPGAFDTSYNGNGDAFTTRLAPTGASLIYSTFLGGSGIDNGFATAVQGTTGGYVTGATFPFGTTPFPTTPGAFDTTANGLTDGFVTKLDLVGDPFTVVLQPAADTNEVDATHCVTATVTDFGGQPVAGVTVRFAVSQAVATHASPSSGAVITDANGQAQFCYTARLPGQNVIHAFADTNGNVSQDTGEPFADATKTWTLPPSTQCKVTLGGSIVTTAGDPASFGGEARLAGNRIQGRQEYVDHGPVQPRNVRSIELASVSCSGDLTSARIFGTARIDGSGTFVFRIDATDGSEPGTSDTYGIRLSDGYSSGQQPLIGGNIQIR